MDTYSTLENVAIVTLAPEFDNAEVVIEELTRKGVIVSVGKITKCSLKLLSTKIPIRSGKC